MQEIEDIEEEDNMEDMEEEEEEELFHFIAPRARMAFSKHGTLRELLFKGQASRLVDLFAVPVQPLYSPPSTPQAQQKKTGILFNLPPEIHSLIFDHIEFIDDVVCFGLTSQYFWTLARGHLDDYYKSFLGTWSGENFVCVGEKVKPDDYPAGLFSAEELDTLRPLRTDVCHGGWYWNCNEPFALSHFRSPTVSDIIDYVDFRDEALSILELCESRAKSKDPTFAARLQQIIPEHSTYFPQDQPWILRNLTTKEFVRSEAIAVKPEYVWGPHIHRIGFGEVLVIRTCWSGSRTAAPLDSETGSPLGVWAGHRFDITTLAKHASETDSSGWSDVSGEVRREITQLWFCEFFIDVYRVGI
ncbi:hypothetical protein GQX73_g6324 [Xylaria multiplex]|uniref:F-box domain-containing protein n=1 Tax=Xylaria multiplex TaxID=323545 RepID=A0A7C8MSI5_9PEZI|nr:hypothetical protein GQX73_g6324 [Xylaria multiplex]